MATVQAEKNEEFSDDRMVRCLRLYIKDAKVRLATAEAELEERIELLRILDSNAKK